MTIIKFYKTLRNNLQRILSHWNYKKVLKKIHKKQKLRVIFYVTEPAKWGYEQLYKLFYNSTYFEPIIIVSLLKTSAQGRDTTRNNMDEIYAFFKNKYSNVEFGYKNKKYIPLKKFSPDIVFYEQPWDIPKINHPSKVSQYALTAYCNYGLDIFDGYTAAYKSNFHAILWKYFIINKKFLAEYEKIYKKKIKNCISIGYSKLDAYLLSNNSKNNFWKDNNKIKIIYAPHHSFGKSELNIATFPKTGKFILYLAKKYQDKTTWIFKPHPRFKYSLLKNNLMSEEEIQNYYQEWGEIGKIYESGDYFDIFKTSDLMITDCASFLGEYLPTLKPLIRLVNKQGSKLNSIGEFITQGYYHVDNNIMLEKIFNDLILNNTDPYLTKRKESYDIFFDDKSSSSEKIFNTLLQICKRES